jgi:hypothetical protein
MRLEIDTPSDGGPVNSECGVRLLEADREVKCAGRGRTLAPIIVILFEHPGEVPQKLYAVYSYIPWICSRLGKDKNGPRKGIQAAGNV